MSSKPTITLETLDTEYPEQISMLDYFKRLQLKIPQVGSVEFTCVQGVSKVLQRILLMYYT